MRLRLTRQAVILSLVTLKSLIHRGFLKYLIHKIILLRKESFFTKTVMVGLRLCLSKRASRRRRTISQQRRPAENNSTGQDYKGPFCSRNTFEFTPRLFGIEKRSDRQTKRVTHSLVVVERGRSATKEHNRSSFNTRLPSSNNLNLPVYYSTSCRAFVEVRPNRQPVT